VKSRDEPPATLGDIVISIETASRQALNPIPRNHPIPPGVASRGSAAKAKIAGRLRALLIHGFLHLLGYDHERSANQARLMFQREHELKLALANAESGPPRMRAG
jgi:probable rRNA maturation factor